MEPLIDDIRGPEWKGTLRSLARAGFETDSLAILDQSGARTPETIISLLESFPSLAQQQLVNAAKLSNEVRTLDPTADFFALMSADEREISHRFDESMGALAPANAVWTLEKSVPLLNLESLPSALPSILEAAHVEPDTFDLRGCLPWPVRDQGRRGTCVSFAATALCELKACKLDEKGTDLSEQFLYWAIKSHTADPIPAKDGTWLEFALEALSSHGISEESECPYNPNFIPGNVSHSGPRDPSHAALHSALSRRTGGNHSKAGKGFAPHILALLKQGRPVAISLPVFEDPISKVNNWSTAVGVRFGIVLDPPPTSVVSGGHAVALTGFVEDPVEPNGGYFIVRNSWSTGWGHQLPNPAAHGPEPGYGQVSASYVQEYLWEFASLE